jgi:hypothetical protein
MAVNIRIGTAFDPKGLNQAQRAFNKIQGNINNLSRNFAIAGTAFAGIAVGLGKSVKVASDLGESVNAINVAFGSSAQGILDFGQTAAQTLGISAVDFNNAAVRFSAFADRIVGSGGDAAGFVAEISTRAADFASVFNIEVAEALGVFQSGLAGEAEPLKRFGINLLDSEVKAYAMANGIGEVGRQLTETEKVQARYGLLMEATAKTQGDFANTSDGLANGMRILKAEITNTQAEIGNALLPILEDMLPIIRELVAEFGEKLKVAVAAVDWESFITSIVDTITFFVEHIETITRVITALFLLNTAYNVARVATGIFQAAAFILGNTFVVTAGKIGLATGAVKLFRTALVTTGIGALVVGLGFIIEAIINTNEAAEKGKPYVDNYGGAIRGSGDDAAWAAGKYGEAKKAAEDFNTVLRRQSFTDVASSFGGSAFDARTALFEASQFTPPTPPKITGGSGGSRGSNPLQELLADPARNIRADKQAVKLEGAGLAKEVANWATSVSKPVAVARKILGRIDRNGATAIANITRDYQNSSTGRAAAANAAAEAEANAFAAGEAIRQAEKAAFEERERVYKSFADSVKNTFAGIKNSILGAFDITSFGGSTNSIARNMDKLLAKLRSFTTNVRNLAGMGLDPALLQQVISAGPVAGARLASALVAGGAGALANLNRGYAEFGVLASEIATTGTESLFNRPSQQNVYNINVSGGVGSGPTIGQAIVDAIKAYERTSGAVWVGA